MDVQQPVPHIKKPSSKKKRHASESGARSARKKRHVSDSVIANVKKPEASSGVEVSAIEMGEELKTEEEIKKEELTPEVMDADEKQGRVQSLYTHLVVTESWVQHKLWLTIFFHHGILH